MSKELGKDCLAENCPEAAQHLKQDGSVMVSVCDTHAEILDKDRNSGEANDE